MEPPKCHRPRPVRFPQKRLPLVVAAWPAESALVPSKAMLRTGRWDGGTVPGVTLEMAGLELQET